MNYLNAKKQYDPLMGVGEQEDSYVPEIYVPQTSQVQAKPDSQVDSGQVMQAGMTGAAAGGPVGAAIAAGGSFLSQYVAQKAADERAKREAIGQAYQKQASDEQNIINTILANSGRALR